MSDYRQLDENIITKVKNELQSDIIISASNIAFAKVIARAVDNNDIKLNIIIMGNSNIQSNIVIRKNEVADINLKIGIIAKGYSELPINVHVYQSNSIQGYISIAGKNSFLGRVEAIPPKVITKEYSSIRDSYVSSKEETFNYGKVSSLVIGNQNDTTMRVFTGFMIDIPKNVTIINASLQIMLANSSNNELELYDFNSRWDEEGITWNNQPTLSKYLGVNSVMQNSKSISFDLTDYIQKCSDTQQKSINLSLRQQNEFTTAYTRTYSKENSSGPALLINYYNPNPISHNKIQVKSNIIIKQNNKIEVLSNINIHRNNDKHDLISNVLIRTPDIIVSNIVIIQETIKSRIIIKQEDTCNMLSNLVIIKHGISEIKYHMMVSQPTMFSNLIIKQCAESDIKSVGIVRQHDNNNILNSIVIKRTSNNEIISSINIGYHSNINSRILVSRELLVMHINIRQTKNNDITSNIFILKSNTLPTKINIKHANNINSKILVTKYNHLQSNIQLYKSNSINCKLFVLNGRNDLHGLIKLIKRNDISSTINIVYNSDMSSLINIIKCNDIKLNIKIRRTNMNDKKSRMIVTNPGNNNLSGSINVIKYKNIPSNIDIKNKTNLTSYIKVIKHKDLKFNLKIKIISGINCRMIVTHPGYDSLSGSINIIKCNNMSSNIYIKNKTDLTSYIKVIKRNDIQFSLKIKIINNISCRMIVTHPGYDSLFGSINITKLNNIPSNIDIKGKSGLTAYIKVIKRKDIQSKLEIKVINNINCRMIVTHPGYDQIYSSIKIEMPVKIGYYVCII